MWGTRKCTVWFALLCLLLGTVASAGTIEQHFKLSGVN